MAEPAVHPAIAHLRGLLGTWEGSGAGSYPTIDDFTYTESVVFSHVGKPFLAYRQGTRHGETGEPLHAESGYLRPNGLNALELVLAQPSGIVEILTGPVDQGDGATTLTLQASHVLTAPTAVEVSAVHRTLRVDADTLTYDVAMAAVGVELTHHLSGELHRVRT